MKFYVALMFSIASICSAETVIPVTNLSDSGAGSLRACVIATGARRCEFTVAGYIDLATTLTVMNGDLTIAGETAPIGGIHVRGSRFEVKASNVVLRHFGVRPGDGPGSNPDRKSVV